MIAASEQQVPAKHPLKHGQPSWVAQTELDGQGMVLVFVEGSARPPEPLVLPDLRWAVPGDPEP